MDSVNVIHAARPIERRTLGRGCEKLKVRANVGKDAIFMSQYLAMPDQNRMASELKFQVLNRDRAVDTTPRQDSCQELSSVRHIRRDSG